MEYQLNQVAFIAKTYSGFRKKIDDVKCNESTGRGRKARQLKEKLSYYQKAIPKEVLDKLIDMNKLELECLEIMKKYPED